MPWLKLWMWIICLAAECRCFLKFTNKEQNKQSFVQNHQIRWKQRSAPNEQKFTKLQTFLTCKRFGARATEMARTISLKLPLFHICDVCSSSYVLKCVFLDCHIPSRLSNTRIFVNNPYVKNWYLFTDSKTFHNFIV